MDSENQATLDQLLLLVYDELRRIANSQLRGERDYHTLQPTALVHELYSRMAIGQNPSFESRAHFLAVSARMMRKILIDSARAHKAVKRGGGAKPLTLDELRHPNPQDSRMLIELDQALAALQQWGEL